MEILSRKSEFPWAGSRVFGICGNPVSHSKSPLLHNHCLERHKLDAVYVALGGEIPAGKEFRVALRAFSLAGVSVTIPYKELALAAADEVDLSAEKAGSANTLVRLPNGNYRAYNTDGAGALAAIGGGSLQAAIVCGNGGTARGILAALAQNPDTQVLLVGRNGAKLSALQEEFSSLLPSIRYTTFDETQAHSLDEFFRPDAGPVLFQTTSIGMDGGQNGQPELYPLPDSWLSGCSSVLDAVYSPTWTNLLVRAKKLGCKTHPGYQMLVYQAIEQMRLFYGVDESAHAQEYLDLIKPQDG